MHVLKMPLHFTNALILLVLLAWPNVHSIVRRYTPVVQTTVGPVRGIALEKSNVFLGIPFGESTAGVNRWKNPITKAKSSEIIDATHFRNPCPGFDGSKQPWIKYLNLTASEDCLNLNIWVPSVRGPGGINYAKNGIPVLVWIYGGGFLYGTNADPVYDGQTFAETYGVIVVNMNYRLGALGFMASTKGGSNYGLRDQNLALKFVKQNIANFGGNPNQITIFGQSAGAMSVLAQIASPQSTGLFQRALSFSPVALSCRDLSQYDRHTNYFFKSFGCKIGNYTCMRDVPFDKILKKQTVVEYIYALKDGKRLNYLEWGPACDVDFLPTDPTTFLLKNHSTYSQYLDAIVVGNVQDEMAAFVPTLLNSTIATDILFDFFWSAELSHGVSKLYDVDPDTGSKLSGYEKVMIALSDYLVNCYTRHLARGIVSSATDSNTFQTYLYLFQHTPSPGANVVFRNMKECAKYPCHASDNVFNFDSVRYIKGLDFRPNFTAFESSLSNAMMSSVADFAAGGEGLYVPYNASKDQRLQWGGNDKVTGKKVVYTTNTDYRSKYCQFWEKSVGYGVYS